MKMQLVFLCTKETRDTHGHWFDFEPYASTTIPCPLRIWLEPTDPERFDPGVLYKFTVDVERVGVWPTQSEQANP